MNRVVLIVLFIGLTTFYSCKDEDENGGKINQSTLEGVVKDEFGGVLGNVKCDIVSPAVNYSALTDENGNFKVEKINVGHYAITISKENYITGTEEIEVKDELTSIELTLTSGASFLIVSDSLLSVNKSADAKNILIESNANWIITSDVPWLKSSVDSGSGNANVSITWESSNDDLNRIGNITFASGSIKKKLRVIQSPPLKILRYQGIIGNFENGVKDSIKVVFNRIISVKSVTTSYEFCLSEISPKVYGQNLSFTYGCAALGGSFPFSISVQDGTETYTFPIEVKFYTSKINVPGYIDDYIITNDNTAIWGISRFPNQLVKISLPDLTLLKRFDLDFIPTAIRWNDFQNTLNIFSKDETCDYDDIVEGNCEYNYLMYMDPETMDITKSEIPLLEGFDADHFGYPYVFPMDLSIMKNGVGIIQLGNNHNYFGVRGIDSDNSDSTFVIPGSSTNYRYVLLNYDKTKVYMTYPSGTAITDIFEMNSSELKTFHSPVPGYATLILPSKKSNRVLHVQILEQFITDMDGYVSKISYGDYGGFYGGTDFSYKVGEEETIYNLQDGLFEILDYKIAFTYFSTKTIGSLSKIQATTDGNFLIALKQGSEATTDLYLFDIDQTAINRIEKQNTGGRIRTAENTEMKSRWIEH